MDVATTRQKLHFPIRLGFAPISDCAPIAVARELGLFENYGLNVVLTKELGWAGIRDKIYYGELDAAQSIAGIAFSLGLGLSELRCEVAVPLIFNLHGNAITLSSALDRSEIGNGVGLKSFLHQTWNRKRPFTLAASHRVSSHHILLHSWLRRHGLSSPGDAEIVFLPPRLMPRHLKAGNIDGYCVGEPWNSAAVLDGSGWCLATSSELSHGHPEKVLLVSGRFLNERRNETIALVAALLEACRMCRNPSFQDDLVAILSSDKYTGASQGILRNTLGPSLCSGFESANGGNSHHFHGDSVNRPTMEKASWVLAGLRAIGALPDITCGSLSRIYREDVFHAAQHCLHCA